MSQLSGLVPPSEVPQYIWTVGSSTPALVISPFNLAESVVMAEAPVELVTTGSVPSTTILAWAGNGRALVN